MGLKVFDHYECDGQIELFVIQEENMGTLPGKDKMPGL